MHKEGIVVKVTERYTVLLCNDGTFHNIKRTKGQVPLIGEKLSLAEKNEFFSFAFFSKIASIACIALFLLFSQGVYNKSNAALAYVIDIDINPSIEVQLNENLNIIGLTAMNQDAEKVIAAIDYKGLSLDEAMDQIISKSLGYGFLKKTDVGLINGTIVSFNDSEKVDTDVVKNLINNSLAKSNVKADVQVAMDNKEILEAARSAGLSVNKYKVYKALVDSGAQITTEAVKDKPIRNLLEMKVDNKPNVNINKPQTDSQPKQNDKINTAKENGKNESKPQQVKKDHKPNLPTINHENNTNSNKSSKPVVIDKNDTPPADEQKQNKNNDDGKVTEKIDETKPIEKPNTESKAENAPKTKDQIEENKGNSSEHKDSESRNNDDKRQEKETKGNKD